MVETCPFADGFTCDTLNQLEKHLNEVHKEYGDCQHKSAASA